MKPPADVSPTGGSEARDGSRAPVVDAGAAAGAALAELVAVMSTLREECPWDRVQTHASLRRHLLEESYETLEALDRVAGVDPAAAPDGDDAFGDLREELGDLLFQVVFHSHLAAEESVFDLAAVIDGVRTKLVGRHPDIFDADPAAGPAAGPAANPGDADGDFGGAAESRGADWERSKVAEKGRSSVMDGIPPTLPALLYAAKVAGKASVVAPDVLADHDGGVAPTDEEALGRSLLASVVAARAAGFDPEAALRTAARNLEQAVRAAEAAAGDGVFDPEG